MCYHPFFGIRIRSPISRVLETLHVKICFFAKTRDPHSEAHKVSPFQSLALLLQPYSEPRSLADVERAQSGTIPVTCNRRHDHDGCNERDYVPPMLGPQQKLRARGFYSNLQTWVPQVFICPESHRGNCIRDE